jgi:hypothetical protein
VSEVAIITCPNPECGQVELRFALKKAKYFDALPTQNQYYVPGEEIKSWRLLPASRAKAMPSFVPSSIVEDYEEACSVETLSPKASATLARRCLQQIIRDFFGVTGRTLHDEIDGIKLKVDANVWKAVDGLRKIGNVGAHPEKDINVIVDVEPGEAAALIRLIEILVQETYVARDRQEKELKEVEEIAAAKEKLKATSATP